MSSEFDLEAEAQKYFSNNAIIGSSPLGVEGFKAGFRKGQEIAALRRDSDLEYVEGLLFSLIRNIQNANLEDSTMGIVHRMWVKKWIHKYPIVERVNNQILKGSK